MDENFWLEKWQNNELGFHLPRVHPLLKRFYRASSSETVLVPLAGKSLDLLYLKQIQPVIGVELSSLACRQFNEENQLGMLPEKTGRFTRYRAPQLELLQGNIFDLRGEDVAQCTQVYDRAALVALSPNQRLQYTQHLMNILPRPLEYWLITLDYDQDSMAGPPFSVSAAEVGGLFQEAVNIECLSRRSIIDNEPHFAARGLEDLFESIYRIELT